MSAGPFIRAIYEADNGDFHPIRVQDTTIGASFGGTTNATAAGPIDNPISAKMSNGNRAFGLKPRSVTLTFPTTAPANYKVGSYIRIPILDRSLYSTIAAGDSVTYLGTTAVVVGKNPERVR